MSRHDDVFHVLKVIRRTLDETHALTTRAIEDATVDRAMLNAYVDRPRDEPSVALYALCRRLIDERATLATALDGIRRDVEHANITPRTNNLGPAARGTVTKVTS